MCIILGSEPIPRSRICSSRSPDRVLHGIPDEFRRCSFMSIIKCPYEIESNTSYKFRLGQKQVSSINRSTCIRRILCPGISPILITQPAFFVARQIFALNLPSFHSPPPSHSIPLPPFSSSHLTPSPSSLLSPHPLFHPSLIFSYRVWTGEQRKT